MKVSGFLVGAVLALWAQGAGAQAIRGESPRTTALEVKLGGYKPLIDRERGLAGNQPFNETFGATPMLLFELEVDRQLWDEFGTAAVGISLGYAEKYARAVVVDSTDGTIIPTSERTGFFVLPIRLMGVYRFDYGALQMGIPLVPYAKAGLVYTPWWTTKGSGVQYVDGVRGAGGKLGYGFTLGLSVLLDILEPRLARDFDTGAGVNHSYLFAEFNYADVNSFSPDGLDLSSRHWMFGITFEF
jgi:hypothetical protein